MKDSVDVWRRLERLERKLKAQRFLLILGIATSALAFSGWAHASAQGPADRILIARGLIIEDEAGRPRIVIGAPVNKVPGRKRADDLFGLAYLDPSGHDRITFGQLPDPATPDGVLPRRSSGEGILINDSDGIERGGYSVLNDDTALLTLDWPKSGEAIALSAGQKSAGLGMFYRGDLGQYRDAMGAFIVPEADRAFAKMSDADGRERLILDLRGSGEPTLRSFDQKGAEISKDVGSGSQEAKNKRSVRTR